MPLTAPTRRSAEGVTAVLLETIAALEQESEVLAGRSAELLIDVSMRKARWVGEMAETLRALTPEQRTQHLALATHAQQLNDRNARLLAARLVSNRARLDALSGAATANTGTALYGTDGRAVLAARTVGAVA
jgi:flagellar biosynthesis/type III secretory pathway chaperone